MKRPNALKYREIGPLERLRRVLHAFGIAFLLTALGARADTLTLKNGNELEGVITDETPEAVQFEELGIKLWIKKSSIDRIERSADDERSDRLRQLKAPRPERKIVYPSEVRGVEENLNLLDEKKALRKQLSDSLRAKSDAADALEKRIFQLRETLNEVSDQLKKIRPSDERNEFGARPAG